METVARKGGLLYPMLVIAAIAVIAFSATGIATMLGWMPPALSRSELAPSPQVRSEGAAERVPRIAGSPTVKAPAPRAPVPAACRDCGVVESIVAVEVPGEGSWLGAAGGAVVGGLLGNQVGRGNGRTAATVAGAGAGAFAGNEIEKSMTSSIRYQVSVRMADGTSRVFHEAPPPAYGVGQKVRITPQGVLVSG
ncbi:MAG: glycine zipper 2TM domain-containing protein [Burkholderiales bacterium]|nr:glycine zipper 2TM domain-containing protein [Burkholderiales bacterium]